MYMKRILSAIAILLLFSFSLHSEEKKVVLNSKTQNINNLGHHYPRSPIRTPNVYIDEYTLLFDTSYEGFTIELLQDEVVVYSDIIDEDGEVQRPDYLEGEYELHFYVGSFVFVGEIEL